MRKKILFLIVLTVLFAVNVKSINAECNYSYMSKVKSLVNNVNISYDYRIENNYAYFDVTLSNLTPEIYFEDTLTELVYKYSDTNNGEITIRNYYGPSGSYRFYSTDENCWGLSIGSKYYKFPTYNIYYNDPICVGASEYSLCQKWVNKLYSYEQFKEAVSNYKDSLDKPYEKIETTNEDGLFDIIIKFYVKYYFIILPLIIIVCLSVIIVERNKNKFSL